MKIGSMLGPTIWELEESIQRWRGLVRHIESEQKEKDHQISQLKLKIDSALASLEILYKQANTI